MNNILTQNLYYITPDIERAIGLDVMTPHYYIITNKTPYSSHLADFFANIILIEESELLATHELLKHPQTVTTLNTEPRVTTTDNQHTRPHVLVFKNTSLIERICAEQQWHLLNPSAEIAKTVEEKISQVSWLGDLKKYLPPHNITTCKEIAWNNKPFILQFNRAHSGEGTYYIDSAKTLHELAEKFPDRDARITDFIEGPMFTVNIVVGKNETLLGNSSYQITGLAPFTDNAFATIGNDWELPYKLLDNTQIEQIKQIGTDIAEKLQKDNWRGLFGIDVILDTQTNEIYLIEINARQPASTSFESQLQEHVTRDTNHVTIFEAHLLALQNQPLNKLTIIPITSGAQIVQRKTDMVPSLPEPYCAERPIFDYIYYPPSEKEDVLVRMQTDKSVMAAHNELSDMGNILMDFIYVLVYKNTYNAPRGAALIIQDEKLLMIERHKLDRHYYILPGGTVEDGEDVRDTTVREIAEETGYEIELTDEEPIVFKDRTGRKLHHYFARIIGGTEKLGGPEADRNDEKNKYAIVWKDISELKDLPIIPEHLKNILVQRFSN